MDLKEKIQQQFIKYPELKYLFFFDEKRDMETDVDELDLEEIKVIKYTSNPFNLKVKLNGEWAGEKIFFYFASSSPAKQEDFKKFPLMDVLVANKELRLGDVSEFMEQFHLSLDKQSLVSVYMQELKYGQVQNVLQPILNNGLFTKENVTRGLVSVFLKFSEIQPWDLLLAKLFIWTGAEYAADFNKAIKKIRDNKLEQILAERLSDLFDAKVTDLTPESLGDLLKKLKYNVITQHLNKAKHDPYTELKISHSISLSKVGLFFEQARNHPKLGNEFIEIILQKSKDVKEDVILQFYGSAADYAWMPDALKWLILNEYMKQLSGNAESVLPGLEKLGLHHEDNIEISAVLNACQNAATCLTLIGSISSYRFNSPEEYVKKYTEDYYKIDQAYRKAIYKIKSVDTAEIPDFVELDQLRDELNNSYDSWLEKINREWLACLKTKNFDYSQLSLPKQYDFYNSEVKPFDQKVVVLISDALRYEVAMELLSEMHNDRKSEADIKFMLASVPSKTSVGMSNLLPGNVRLFNDDQITIDSINAPNREAILKTANAGAVTVNYSVVEQNNHEQNRELFKAPVVYIYHDVIDSTGDKKVSERRTFEVVRNAISEIKKLVKKIHSAYNVSRVLITADHGFLYNDKEISEADKEDPTNGDAIIQHNRFAIYDKPVNPSLGYCVPLSSVTKFTDERWVVFPASTNRYKRQGVGHQFVHCGPSLQELIVPLIESARRREDITRKVNVKLLTTDPRIISNILRVEILQENNVSRYEKGRIVKLGIYKGYDLVSTEQEMALESSSELASERLFTVTLTLTKPGLSQSALALKIFDSEDNLNPLVEKTVINNTLIQTDF